MNAARGQERRRGAQGRNGSPATRPTATRPAATVGIRPGAARRRARMFLIRAPGNRSSSYEPEEAGKGLNGSIVTQQVPCGL